MYKIVRNESAIDAILNVCAEREEEGNSAVPGMTYEQGVKAGIEWLTGKHQPHPLDE